MTMKIAPQTPQKNFLSIYMPEIYIYIYMCVCVWVLVLNKSSKHKLYSHLPLS